MKFVRAFLVVILIKSILIFPSALASKGEFFDFNGIWEGHIKGFQAPLLRTKRTHVFKTRLWVKGDEVQVFYQKDQRWNEVKAGAFRIFKHKSNALIYAINSGTDQDGAWVETWSFSVTKKDKNSLLVYWYSVINNNDAPLEEEYSRIATGASGVFRKIKS